MTPAGASPRLGPWRAVHRSRPNSSNGHATATSRRSRRLFVPIRRSPSAPPGSSGRHRRRRRRRPGGLREGLRRTPSVPRRLPVSAVAACHRGQRGRNRRRAAGRREALALRIPEDRRAGGAAPSPEAAVLAGERRDALLTGLARLSEADREVITLRYLLELSEAETAATLDVPPGPSSPVSRARWIAFGWCSGLEAWA